MNLITTTHRRMSRVRPSAPVQTRRAGVASAPGHHARTASTALPPGRHTTPPRSRAADASGQVHPTLPTGTLAPGGASGSGNPMMASPTLGTLGVPAGAAPHRRSAGPPGPLGQPPDPPPDLRRR